MEMMPPLVQKGFVLGLYEGLWAPPVFSFVDVLFKKRRRQRGYQNHRIPHHIMDIRE